ncbi:MAG: DUF3189 family protein [Bacillota bacterium]
MIILYHCYGGAHSSVLSAAIHCGYINTTKIPLNKDILNIPRFDKTTKKEIGIPFLYGNDDNDNKIYIQGMGSSDKIIVQILKDLMKIYNISEKDIVLVDTLKNVNVIVRIGGFLSRGLGLIFPGRILTVLGLKFSYKKFIRTVDTIKIKISQ